MGEEPDDGVGRAGGVGSTASATVGSRQTGLVGAAHELSRQRRAIRPRHPHPALRTHATRFFREHDRAALRTGQDFRHGPANYRRVAWHVADVRSRRHVARAHPLLYLQPKTPAEEGLTSPRADDCPSRWQPG